jgi:hypothetical protein
VPVRRNLRRTVTAPRGNDFHPTSLFRVSSLMVYACWYFVSSAASYCDTVKGAGNRNHAVPLTEKTPLAPSACPPFFPLRAHVVIFVINSQRISSSPENQAKWQMFECPDIIGSPMCDRTSTCDLLYSFVHIPVRRTNRYARRFVGTGTVRYGTSTKMSHHRIQFNLTSLFHRMQCIH